MTITNQQRKYFEATKYGSHGCGKYGFHECQAQVKRFTRLAKEGKEMNNND